MDRQAFYHFFESPHRLSTKAVAVFSALTWCNDPKKGICKPTITTLARMTTQSERSVNNALAELRERGFITSHTVRNRTDHATTLYQLYPLGDNAPRAPSPCDENEPRAFRDSAPRA